MSGRRVTGREAIASDAVGVLDAVAATGTPVRRGRRHTRAAADHPARLASHDPDASKHAGVPISIISKWAGHYDSAFTQKTYVHASEEDLQRGQAALAKIHKIA